MKSNSLRGGRRRRQRRLGESSRGRFRPSVLLESPFRSLSSNEHTADVTERRVDTSQSACRAGREAGNDEAATPIARGEGKGRKLFALSFAGLVPSAALGRRERERELQEKKRVRVPSWSRCLFLYAIKRGVAEEGKKRSGRTIEFFFLRFARSGFGLTHSSNLVRRHSGKKKRRANTCPCRRVWTLSVPRSNTALTTADTVPVPLRR